MLIFLLLVIRGNKNSDVVVITKGRYCKYKQSKIKVEKKRDGNTDVWIFIATSYEDSAKVLGYLRCGVCEVMSGTLTAGHSECGIGEELTKLCFGDEDINKGKTTQNNECPAVKLLENYPDKLRWAKSNTKDLLLVGRDGGVGERDSDLVTMAALLAMLYSFGYHSAILFLPPGSIRSIERPSIDDDTGKCIII